MEKPRVHSINTLNNLEANTRGSFPAYCHEQFWKANI